MTGVRGSIEHSAAVLGGGLIWLGCFFGAVALLVILGEWLHRRQARSLRGRQPRRPEP